jgi:hypothetical protein
MLSGMNELLFNLYVFKSSSKASGRKESIRSFCRNILKSENQCRRIQDVWKLLELEKDIDNNVSPFDNSVRDKIEKQYPLTEEADSTGSRRDFRPTSKQLLFR